eukprot:5376701-Karenia_brevis.AAC.1
MADHLVFNATKFTTFEEIKAELRQIAAAKKFLAAEDPRTVAAVGAGKAGGKGDKGQKSDANSRGTGSQIAGMM